MFLVGLIAIGNANAALYKRPGVKLETTGNKITSLILQAPVTCELDTVISSGLYLGQPEMEPFRIPIRKDRTFSYHRYRTQYGISNHKLEGRVLKDRIVGRWSVVLQESFDVCWTGKSRRNPWIKFSALKQPTQPESAASIDTDFGTAGVADLTLPDASRADHVVGLSSGKLVAVGVLQQGPCAGYYSARFTSDGAPDLAYGDGGQASGTVGCEIPSAALALPHDRVLIGTENVSSPCASLIRLAPNGDKETWPSGAGAKTTICVGPGTGQRGNVVNDVQTDPLTRVVAAGRAQWGSRRSKGYVFRLKGNGMPDRSFGKNGQVQFFPKRKGSSFSDVSAIRANETNLVAAGSFGNKTMVAKLREDGSRARGYGNNGIFTIDLDRNSGCLCTRVFDMTRDSHGRTTVASVTSKRDASGNQSNNQLTLFRVTRSGQLDRSFGNNGIVRLKSENYDFVGGSMISQPNGKLLVSGSVEGPGVFQFTVFRFNIEGDPDQSFFDDGIFESEGGLLGGYATDLLWDHGGFVASGGTSDGEVGTASLVRFLP
jgi:uncharacterized delta-60 repeat protein